MHIGAHFQRIVATSKDPVVLEIGACNGDDTAWLCQPPVARLIAVEPDPRNLEVLKRRRLPITLIEGAVSNRRGEVTLWMSAGRAEPTRPENTASSSILQPTGHIVRHPCYTFEEKAVVRALTLDDIFDEQGLDRIDFIWCDAQGSEADIVRGGQRALAKTRYLYCEFCDIELYDGQIPLREWMKLLPGRWSIEEMYIEDVLLKNDDLATG